MKIILFILSIALSSIACGNDNISLTENSVGSLKLTYGMPLSIEVLKTAFPNDEIKLIEWKQEGPDTIGYIVLKDGIEIISFKAQDDDKNLLDTVYSKHVIDQYSISIGSTYSEIKKERPNIIFETNYHYHTYVGSKESNIVYEIDGDDKLIKTSKTKRALSKFYSKLFIALSNYFRLTNSSYEGKLPPSSHIDVYNCSSFADVKP